MLQTQEHTSRRFSHELHDELGQGLAAIRANIAAARKDDFDTRRHDCLQLVDSAIADVRELSQLLRPVVLDDFGLNAALRWLADKFSQRTNIDVTYESNLDVHLEDEDETHVFRIAQEALTNIARHSGASRVSIRLFVAASHISLTIEDNGRGISAPEVQKHSSLGMVGMRARARQVGGELRISSPDTGGVHLEVTIPMHKGEGERA
jgi:signal transduction histidine kinase